MKKRRKIEKEKKIKWSSLKEIMINWANRILEGIVTADNLLIRHLIILKLLPS